MFGIAESNRSELKLASALHEHLIRAVDQNIRHFRIINGTLNRPEPDHVVDDFTGKKPLFMAVQKEPLRLHRVGDGSCNLLFELLGLHMKRCLRVDTFDDEASQARIDALINIDLFHYFHSLLQKDAPAALSSAPDCSAAVTGVSVFLKALLPEAQSDSRRATSQTALLRRTSY